MRGQLALATLAGVVFNLNAIGRFKTNADEPPAETAADASDSAESDGTATDPGVLATNETQVDPVAPAAPDEEATNDDASPPVEEPAVAEPTADELTVEEGARLIAAAEAEGLTLEERIARLEAAVAYHEALAEALGNGSVDEMLEDLREQLKREQQLREFFPDG